MLVDSHCHLQLMDYAALNSSPEMLIKEAQAAGVSRMLCVATHPDQRTKLQALHESHPDALRISLGLHPNEEIQQEPTVEDWLNWGQVMTIVAIGETGLDYFRQSGDLEWQRQRFRTQIQAAKQLKKPIIIHTRAAKADTLQIMLEEQAMDVGGVMHCFTEDWDMAKAAIDMNFMISFSGIVTFKNAQALQEVAKLTPLDHILVETDCPYLAPMPHRGKVNRPSYVKHVAAYVAELKNISFEALAEQTTSNYHRLFGS